jgi:methionine synthase I (cobalamin-dependent)
MASFIDTLRSGRVLLMDGAMGTELQRAGICENECYEAWNLTQPERVRAIHQAYVVAGAEVLLTNTFQAAAKGRIRTESSRAVNAGLELARSVVNTNQFVLADIGPVSWSLWPLAYGPDPVLQTAGLLRESDSILLETWSHPRGMLFAKYALRDSGVSASKVSVLFSVTYMMHPDGTISTPQKHSPERFAKYANQYGISALGVNCGRDIGMDEIIEIVRRYRQVTDMPLFARPNAGSPNRVGDRWVYPLTPEKMAERLPELLEAGVNMIGGCCGTTPEYIAAMRPIVDAWNTNRGFPSAQA